MQPGEREFHLRLHTGHPHHPAPARLPGQVVKQHALAHPRVTAHHQGTALTSPDRADEPVELITFGEPVHQLDRARLSVNDHRSPGCPKIPGPAKRRFLVSGA